jgi:hypothetical protein
MYCCVMVGHKNSDTVQSMDLFDHDMHLYIGVVIILVCDKGVKY